MGERRPPQKAAATKADVAVLCNWSDTLAKDPIDQNLSHQ